MIDISKLSSRYDVRELTDADAGSILKLCEENTQYYLYCEAEPSMEQVLNDLHITPPGVDLKDKYYVGFYQTGTLIAVMDLIDGYPEQDIAFVGFFMMKKDLQGQKLGTALVQEAADYLKSTGKTAIRLAIDKGNPQSTHFWKKTGFLVIKEVDRNGWTALVAEKQLRRPDPVIRPIRESEQVLLNDYLYEAIFIPEGVSKPPREIIFQPELQVYVRDFGTGPADLCYVAEDNGEIVGAAWSRIMNDYGHIDDDTPSLAIAVLEGFRGQGIGTALLEALLSSLKKKGFAAASLSVQKANPAVHLYDRLGFGTVREEADEQIMRKEL